MGVTSSCDDFNYFEVKVQFHFVNTDPVKPVIG